MRFPASAFLISAMLLAGSALPVFAGNVRTDYNHQANFAQYHTYTWGNVKTSDPFYVDRIKQAVDKQLQAKGWQLVTSGASVTIFASDNLHNQKEVQTMYDGFGGGWGGGWGWGGGGGGLGWLRISRWIWRRHNHHDQPTSGQPGGRLIRWQFQESALERSGNGGLVDERKQEYQVSGQ
jgi:hypothetical protein